MRKDNVEKKDKLMTSPPTTGSYGISTADNMTTASEGTDGDDSDSYFPHFHVDKNWTSKVTERPGSSTDADIEEADDK